MNQEFENRFKEMNKKDIIHFCFKFGLDIMTIIVFGFIFLLPILLLLDYFL